MKGNRRNDACERGGIARAPVPSVFPSAASPDGKTEVMFKPGSGESVRTGRLGTPAVPGQTCSAPAQARSPRALETIGIHLKIALGLSNEVGPPQRPWKRRRTRKAAEKQKETTVIDWGAWGIGGAIGAGVIAVVWWLVRHAVETAQRSTDEFRQKRLKVYMGVLEPMLTMFEQAKGGDPHRGKRKADIPVDQLRRAMFDIKLMATDEVVRAFDKLVIGFTGDPLTDQEAGKRLVDLYGGLLLAMRKDLGNPTTTLTKLEMLKVIITDAEKYYLESGSK